MARVQRRPQIDQKAHVAWSIGAYLAWEVRNEACRTTDFVVWSHSKWIMTLAVSDEFMYAWTGTKKQLQALVRAEITGALHKEGLL